MRDESSPGETGDDAAAAPLPPPRYGEYAPPGWTPPAPPQDWTAPAVPPKPGLIPLRPLLLGDIVVAAFQLIRRNPRPTFWFALGIGFAATVITVAIVAAALVSLLSGVDLTSPPELPTVRAVVGGVLVAALVAVVVQIVLTALPQAVVILEVVRGTLGERRTLRELRSLARGRVGALMGWLLVLGGGVAFAVLLTTLGLAELALSGGPSGLVVAVGVGLLAALVILVAALWLGTRLAFVPSLIVVERRPVGAAVRRSWTMTRGGFWRILGVTLLVTLILQVGAQIVMMPIAFLGALVDRSAALDARAIVVAIVSLAVQVAVAAVAIVIQAAVPTLLYLDTRMRREGLDAALQRDAAERAAGTTPSSDPFG